MSLRRVVGAGVVAGSVVAGSVAGAVLFAPALGVAQDATTSPTEESESRPEGLCAPGALLEAAAVAIGIDEGDLEQALQDGQTISQVARENGVQVSAVVDALVTEAESSLDEAVEEGRLTEAEADEKRAGLEGQMTALVNSELSGRGLFGGPGFGHHGNGPDTAAGEETSEITVT